MQKLARSLVAVGLLLAAVGIAAIGEAQTPSCRTALLIIDVQSAWLGSAAITIDDVLIQDKTAEIAASARAGGVPVVFVIDVGHRDMFSDEELELAKPLEVLAGDFVVEKTSQNGFLRTNLEEVLRAIGATTVLVTGYASHECVAQTAKGAAMKGFEVIIIEDGHSGGAGGQWARRQNTSWRDRDWQVTPSGEIDFPRLCVPSNSEEGV